MLLSEDPEITETWLHSSIINDEVIPPTHQIFRKDRDSRGGGVAIVIKKDIDATLFQDTANIESVWVKMRINNSPILVGGVYRPPNAPEGVLESLYDFVNIQSPRFANMIIAGDFNLPNITWETLTPLNPNCRHSDLLTSMTFANDLSQIVTCPTRITRSSSTMLDLIFISNELSNKTFNCYVREGISDHRLIWCEFTGGLDTKEAARVVKVPNYTRALDESILDHLELAFENFCELSTHEITINDLWFSFKGTVHTCIDRFVPRRCKCIRKRNPWITRDILHLKRKINRIRIKKRKRDRLNISHLRRLLRAMIHTSKQYFHNVTLEKFLESDPRKFWRYITQPKQPVCSIKQNGVDINDPFEIASAFNQYFSSVYTSDNHQTPESGSPQHHIPHITFTKEGIFAALLNLNTKKSVGPDMIPNIFLRRYAESCSNYLLVLFNKSIELGQIPDDWKTAKIVPIFKAGDIRCVTNYRPVSLLCSSVKVIEHVLYKHIVSFLEENVFF